MALLKCLLALREMRETRDAQSLRRARDARAQADAAVTRAERALEQGLMETRRQEDALFDGMRGALWPLSTVQGMHGRLEALRQGAETLRDGVAEAEAQRTQSQARLETAQAVHRRSRKQADKASEVHAAHEREARLLSERKEDMEMEEVAASRRPVA
ncbi:hypothetical protein CAL29_05370 [Bordetella genomosp. 10]|uniref:Type III secretion protein n=1 Tax=Bordetella genomosp. 10 TaxID=1416804 RepID=A0A261SLC4_9BORD|nr:YscO family type III secretion system apparatus protein [Bordetella genomosp. 10]OZI37807.1 hypothetical protein CAL29_05370 [Bordetella genomosp. 10]